MPRMTERRWVELVPLEAVEGRAREGVVVVVPGLAERERREPRDVGRVVVVVEPAKAVEVADRVDAPRDVVHEEEAHGAAPEQAHQRGVGGAADRPAEAVGNRQGGEQPDREEAADHAHAAVLEQVGRVLAGLGAAVVHEHPAEVGVVEAAEARAVADVRRMRIALLVGMGVMLAMVGDPGDHGALDGERAGDGKRIGGGLVGGERAMGQQAVIADRDAEGGDHVHEEEDPEAEPVDAPVPEDEDRGDQRQEREDDAGDVGVAVDLSQVRPPYLRLSSRVLGISDTSTTPVFCVRSSRTGEKRPGRAPLDQPAARRGRRDAPGSAGAHRGDHRGGAHAGARLPPPAGGLVRHGRAHRGGGGARAVRRHGREPGRGAGHPARGLRSARRGRGARGPLARRPALGLPDRHARGMAQARRRRAGRRVWATSAWRCWPSRSSPTSTRSRRSPPRGSQEPSTRPPATSSCAGAAW